MKIVGYLLIVLGVIDFILSKFPDVGSVLYDVSSHVLMGQDWPSFILEIIFSK